MYEFLQELVFKIFSEDPLISQPIYAIYYAQLACLLSFWTCSTSVNGALSLLLIIQLLLKCLNFYMLIGEEEEDKLKTKIQV